MKPVLIFGIALIVLGVLALTYEGISYTTREKVIDFGPLQVTADQQRNIPLPPVLGALAIIGGVGILVFRKK
jgi:uncharacterized membrane protein HdeD (DUF308 family)